MRFLLFACMLLVPLLARAQELTVFAAASLTDAMKDVSAQWAQAGHPALRMSFGSSSTLARQIEQGAPANLFASADQKWMDYLAEKNLIAADTRKDLLGNDLVLVVPANKPQHVTIGPDFDLLSLLGRTAASPPAIPRMCLSAFTPSRRCANLANGMRSRRDWRVPTMCGPRCCWWSAARRPSASSMRPMPPCPKP